VQQTLDAILKVMKKFLLLFLLIIAITPSARALTIEKARVGVHSDKTRLVLEMSEASQFHTFLLENPYRLVIDMPRLQWNAGGLDAARNAQIKSLRHGALKPGFSRVVLDLKKPIALKNAFLLPKQKTTPHRLVIDYTPISPTTFKTAKSKTFGQLNTGEPPQEQQQQHIQTTQTETANTPKPPKKPTNIPPPLEKPMIIIDPGHGGPDPGAIGKNKVHEKTIVLKLARELRDQLLATGRYRVKMTRDSDVFIRLRDRVKFARKHDGDLFVSIHADSIEKPHIQGASVYTLSEKASDAQAARLAARENKSDLIAGIDFSDEDEDVVNILMDLATRDTMNQSNFFAEKLSKVMKSSAVKTLSNTHRSAGFAVLKSPDIPSVLIEAGFMSNKQEANRLNTKAYRKKIATTIRRGIDKYFEQVQKNQRI